MWELDARPAPGSSFANLTIFDRPPDRARLRATLTRATVVVASPAAAGRAQPRSPGSSRVAGRPRVRPRPPPPLGRSRRPCRPRGALPVRGPHLRPAVRPRTTPLGVRGRRGTRGWTGRDGAAPPPHHHRRQGWDPDLRPVPRLRAPTASEPERTELRSHRWRRRRPIRSIPSPGGPGTPGPSVLRPARFATSPGRSDSCSPGPVTCRHGVPNWPAWPGRPPARSGSIPVGRRCGPSDRSTGGSGRPRSTSTTSAPQRPRWAAASTTCS